MLQVYALRPSVALIVGVTCRPPGGSGQSRFTFGGRAFRQRGPGVGGDFLLGPVDRAPVDPAGSATAVFAQSQEWSFKRNDGN